MYNIKHDGDEMDDFEVDGKVELVDYSECLA